MKKVLISSYSLDYGGIEKSLINLLKNFNYDKYKVTLVLEKKEGVFLSDVPKNVIIKEYKISKNKNPFIRKISNLINRIKFIINNFHRYNASICYATYSKPCGFVARCASLKSIIYVHSNYYQVFDRDKTKLKNYFNELKINRFKKVIFVSNESKNDVCNIIHSIENKSVTINNLIDVKEMLELSKKRINEKKGKNKIVLFVGRLDESSKRVSIILEAAKKIKETNKKIIFWIIGSGPDEKKYKSFVKKNKLDNVIFCGPKKNPYPYFRLCDCVILTSRYEGFPVVYNEAIVFNKPIITTIDATDDYISIKNRFGYIIKDDEVSDKLEEILKKNDLSLEKVDFDSLNKKRIEALEMVMESK